MWQRPGHDRKKEEDEEEEEAAAEQPPTRVQGEVAAPKPGQQRAWESAIRWREDGRSFKIGMLGVSMDDAEAGMWASWFGDYMKPYAGDDWGQGFLAQEVDFSKNYLTSIGVRRVLNALWQAHVEVRVLKMHHNKLELSNEVAGLIATGCLREVHLSHNLLDANSGAELVLAAASAWTEDFGYLYPRADEEGTDAEPLWLRLEMNCIDCPIFERRLKAGFARLKRQSKLVCHVDGTKGCSPHACAASSSPPIVHLPYLHTQRKDTAGIAVEPTV